MGTLGRGRDDLEDERQRRRPGRGSGRPIFFVLVVGSWAVKSVLQDFRNFCSGSSFTCINQLTLVLVISLL